MSHVLECHERRLSLLTRLCGAEPPPRFHTVRYAGVLASASKLPPCILPEPPEKQAAPALAVAGTDAQEPRPRRCPYRPWAELMMRTFQLDVVCCPRCSGRLRLVALMTEEKEIRRYLAALSEATVVPERARHGALRIGAAQPFADAPARSTPPGRASLGDLAPSPRHPRGGAPSAPFSRTRTATQNRPCAAQSRRSDGSSRRAQSLPLPPPAADARANRA